MNNIITIVKKELKRVFSDRKLIVNLFVIPVISLLLIYSGMGIFLINKIANTEEHKTTIYQIGIPTSIEQVLGDMDVELVLINESDISAIRDSIDNEEKDLFVRYDEGFETAIQNGDLGEYSVYFSEANDYSSKAYSQLNAAMNIYEKTVLASRVGGYEYLNVFNESIESKTDENDFISGMLSGLMTMMLIVFIFAGCMQQGIDTIAGEKERGSFYPLLMMPISRKKLAIGKAAGLGITAIMSSLATFTGIISSLLIVKAYINSKSDEFVANVGGEITSLFDKIDMSFLNILLLLITIFATAMLFSSFVCYLSARAKTIKEASTLITPFYMVIMFLSYVPYITQKTPAFTSLFIPFYGNVAGLYKIFEGSSTMTDFLICVAMSIIYSAILVLLTSKLFDNEKVMF